MGKTVAVVVALGIAGACTSAYADESYRFRISCPGKSQFEVVQAGKNEGDAKRIVQTQYGQCNVAWIGQGK
ncbi:MAG: hypothetical protein NVV74_15775 [Magnetospirillum sp.]|nr:hypothetical protein [Magnetospirillum sp.]